MWKRTPKTDASQLVLGLQGSIADVEKRLRDLARRLDDVEDDGAHAHHRINKLQGRLTGGERKKRIDESEPEPQIDEVDLNERIRRGLPIGVANAANPEP